MGLFERKKPRIETGKKRARPRTMLLCPHCGGSDLYFEAGLITGYKYHCKHCQYMGSFIIEKEVEDFIEEEGTEEEDRKEEDES